MAFRNKIATACTICREPVPVGQGWTEGPPWVTKCQKCSGPVATTKVLVKMAGAEVAFTLTGPRLDDVRFQAFRSSTAGCSYDGKSNVAPVARAVVVLQNLRNAGFSIDVAPEAAAVLQAQSAAMRQTVEKAEARADALDEILRLRGQALFPFQKKGVRWLASRLTGLLGDEMGLGKTIQALASIPDNAPVLVISPAVAKGVWRREAAKWRPEFKVTICEGRGSFQIPTAGEIVVINYDILPDGPSVNLSNPRSWSNEEKAKWAVFVSQFPEGTILISDEAQNLANSRTARTTRFRALSKAVRERSGRVWLLTATPLMNKQSELWSIFQAAGLAYEAFGSWENFVEAFGGSYTGYQGALEWGTPNPAVCGPMIAKVCLRRLREEVLPELPAKQYQEHYVDISASARKICDKTMTFFDDYTRFSRINDDPKPENGEISNEIEQAVDSLRKVNPKKFEQLSGARQALATAKIPALLELVESFEEQGEPVVVFSAHRKPIDIFAGREGWAVITGDTPAADRSRIEDAFQRGELKGIAGTIKAAGVAITLTKAAHAIFVDLEWTPAWNAQAEDRLSRIGQLRSVMIHTLVANHPLDQRVFELLTWKRGVIAATVDAARRQAGDEVEINLPDVDFAALDAATKAEQEAETKAAAEAEARRQEMETKFGGPETEEERQERRKRQRKADRESRWAREATEDGSPRTLPQTPREVWSAQALATLADLDPDRARERNNAGFSASDGGIGHKLAYLANVTGLTAQQWGFAMALCAKYHRQIGVMPNA